MTTQRKRTQFSEDLTTAGPHPEFDLTHLSAHGNFEITCHAVDADGNYIAADAGAGTVEAISVSGTEWEQVVQQDRTTPENIDFTGNSRTVVFERDPVSKVRVRITSDVTGTDVDALYFSVYEAS